MKKASITEAKNNLSALIDRVKSGSPVLIVDRGRPVARLESAGVDQLAGETGQLEHLIRAGVVRAARAPFPKARIASEPPRPRKGSAVDALLEERRSGR
jgi:prevent-host-death family protein